MTEIMKYNNMFINITITISNERNISILKELCFGVSFYQIYIKYVLWMNKSNKKENIFLVWIFLDVKRRYIENL